MAEVGELTWVAEIQEIAQSKREAQEMTEGLEGVADEARSAESAMNGVDDSSQSLSDSFGDLDSSSFFLVGALQLLGGQLLMFIARMVGVEAAAAKVSAALKSMYGWIAAGGLSGAVSGLLAKGSAFISWLAAGSAGALAFAAAIGAVIGLIAVWILKITGVLDVIGQLGAWLGEKLPGWARDAFIALISITVGWLAVLGAVILGFMEGGLSGALDKGKEMLSIFGGAWGRLFDGIMETAGNFKDDIVTWASGLADDVTSTVTGAFTGAWNAVVPDSLDIPELSIGGQSISTTIAGQDIGGSLPEVSIGGQSLNLPQLDTGGMVDSGGAAQLHEDELVLPADVSRDVIDALRGGGGGGSSSPSVVIEEQIIEIGDQTLDVSELDRSQMELLAELIAEQQAGELETLV